MTAARKANPNRVPVRPELIRWACERAGLAEHALAKNFKKIGAWLRGADQPTLRQLEAFAKATHAPFGCFFLPELPVETIPIPDFRTIGSAAIRRASAELLDTIYICQQRQEWYREFVRASGEPACAFVGSGRVTDEVVSTAERMRAMLNFGVEERHTADSWTDALRRFIERADELGVLVTVNGVVGSDTHRRLDPGEFRGFALADPFAPLVFVNGADAKAAQMFTLAHELAHLWLGESALSDVDAGAPFANAVERWCNGVAAELLVPLAALRAELLPRESARDAMNRLARRFKVSTLVILRRLLDAGALTREQFDVEYASEMARFRQLKRTGGGGNFYLTTAARVGKRFARAVFVSTYEGRSSFTEACRLLGFKNMKTFEEFGASLGVVA